MLPIANKQKIYQKKSKFITVEKYGRIELTKKGHNTTDRDWYVILTSVIMIAIVLQVVIDIFMLPVFDVQISPISYQQWFAMRFIVAFPFILFNVLVLFLVYWVISPIISYEYIHDMVENINTPYFVHTFNHQK